MEEEKSIPSPTIRGVILGVVISSIVAALTIAYLDSDIMYYKLLVPPLIVSAATLFAATMAINRVDKNIRNQNRLHKDSQIRKLIAARALLSLALREIEVICISALRQLTDEEKIDEKRSIIISSAAQETIKLVIEHSDNEDQKILSDFLMYYQIAISQFNNYITVSSSDKNVDHFTQKKTIKAIVCWISLRAIAWSYLYYVHGKSDAYDIKYAYERFKKIYSNLDRMGRYKGIKKRELERIFDEELKNKHPGFLDPDFLTKNSFI